MADVNFDSKTVKQSMTRSTGNKLELKPSETMRVQLTADQAKAIEDMYSDLAADIRKQIVRLDSGSSVSEMGRQLELAQMLDHIDDELAKIGGKVNKTVQDTMYKTANAVVKDNLDFLTKAGMRVNQTFVRIPQNVVHSIASGQVYSGNWSLSKSIWSNVNKNMSDIQRIVAEGVQQGKSTVDIARDLEKFVDPKATKNWQWKGIAKNIDYNAQRLARTMISHAYQQSLINSTRYNPFVEGLQWLTSGVHTCEICADREGKVYKPDDLPMDHPNGMCTFVAVIPQSMTEVADRIGDWYNGKSDPEMDKFVQSLYG